MLRAADRVAGARASLVPPLRRRAAPSNSAPPGRTTHYYGASASSRVASTSTSRGAHSPAVAAGHRSPGPLLRQRPHRQHLRLDAQRAEEAVAEADPPPGVEAGAESEDGDEDEATDEPVAACPLVDLPPEDNRTRLRVARQSYIPTPRSKLISQLREEMSEEEWGYMAQALRCLESVYQVEYQLAGEELHQVLLHLNHSVIVPDGIQLLDTAGMESISSQDGWGERDLDNWELEGVPLSALYNPSEDEDSINTVYVSPADMHSLEAKFLEMILILLDKAHFQPMGARNSALADTLNASYLSQFFVRPDSSAVDSEFAASLTDATLRDKFGAVAVFTRGWGKERKSGRLLFAKLDYMQQSVAKLLIRFIQRIFKLLQELAKEQAESARLELPDALAPPQRRPQPLPSPSRPTGYRKEVGDSASVPAVEAEAAKPKRWAKPKPPSLRKALGRTGRNIKEGLAYYGLIPPLSRIDLEDFDDVWPVRTSRQQPPVYIERRTVEDAMGKGIPLKDLQGERLKTLFGKIELEEPTFHEMLVLCRPKRKTDGRVKQWRQAVKRRMAKFIDGDEPPDRPYFKERILLRVYKDIPVPLWRIAFPFKALAFRPIDLIKVDLIALVGIGAIIGQVKSDNAWLQLVWITSLGVQILRVGLKYRRKFKSFENFVSKTMLSKTVAGQEGVIEFLSRSAALQQYKQAMLLYYMVVREGPGKLESHPEEVAQDIENLVAAMGSEVSFDVIDAEKELQRLGLLTHNSGPNQAGPSKKVVPPEEAVEVLREHWSSILTSQLKQQPASGNIDHAIQALDTSPRGGRSGT